MTTQEPVAPTLQHQRAIAHSDSRQRRDAALAALAARAGAEMPAIQEGGRPKPAPPYMLGEALVSALLAEAVVALAEDVDQLRQELAALQPAPVSATNGAKPR